MTKKIALVGTAGSAVEVPFGDPDWEIWGVGNRAAYVTRATRWFELHRLAGEPRDWAAEWRRIIKTWSDECEVWMFYPEDGLGPQIIPFDPKPLVDKFGSFFMTSSFSWMMAQAIEEGATEIGLWGVDMEYGTEYVQQRTGLRHFIEIAKVKGIMVRRVVSSGIAYEPIPYPFWQDDPLLAKLSLRQTATLENIKTITDSIQITQSMIERNKGALSEIDTMLSGDPDLGERRKSLVKETGEMVTRLDGFRQDIAHLNGLRDEQLWVHNYLLP